MSRLPVRTHFAPDPDAAPLVQSRRRSKADTRQLNKRIWVLKRKGYANVEIADELDVTPTTVSKHLRGYIKTTNRAKGARS